MLSPEKLPDPAPFGSGGYIHVVLFSANAPVPTNPNTIVWVLTSMRARDEEQDGQQEESSTGSEMVEV